MKRLIACLVILLLLAAEVGHRDRYVDSLFHQ